MQILREPPPGFGPAVVTIGNFDGLHLGHQALIRRTVEAARNFNCPSVVMTFSTHPAQVLAPEKHTPRLCADEEMTELLAGWGVSLLYIVNFSKDFAAKSAQQFINEDLLALFKPH